MVCVCDVLGTPSERFAERGSCSATSMQDLLVIVLIFIDGLRITVKLLLCVLNWRTRPNQSETQR